MPSGGIYNPLTAKYGRYPTDLLRNFRFSEQAAKDIPTLLDSSKLAVLFFALMPVKTEQKGRVRVTY